MADPQNETLLNTNQILSGLVQTMKAGVTFVAAPAHNNSSGTPNQIAYDSSGNLYVCYAVNSWAKFTGNISF